MIITIDGPSGTGKSSTAKGLAEALGFLYFDTGAMYRAVTYACMEASIDLSDLAQVDELLSSFSFRIEQKNRVKHYFVNDREVTEIIRTAEVTKLVSTIAAIPAVRHAMVPIQREVGQKGNAVFEGRDLGTVVFPKADVKIFLTARPEVRAERRYKELISKNPALAKTVTMQSVLEDLDERDEHDTTRKHSPLRPAEDALKFDTSDLTLKQVISALKAHIETKRQP